MYARPMRNKLRRKIIANLIYLIVIGLVVILKKLMKTKKVAL